VRRLLDEHPHLRLILIGDSGQEDPEIYAAIARDTLAAEITAAGVPMLAVDDSAQIAAHAAALGLLDEDAVATVRAELAH
jgi:Uncharacterized conserved protein (DUF2183)